MNYIIKTITLLALVMITASAHAQWLKTSGKIIVNDKGEKVILRGMGLGGWMLQEGYMFRLGNIGQQYKIRQKIEELVGTEKATQFYKEWLANHTTKTDIDSMAAWGFNSMRLPMHYNLYTLPVDKEKGDGTQTFIEEGFALTDSLLRWCKANRIYLFLDLHATPGGQGNDLPISDRDPSKPSLWESAQNQQKTIALWKKLAERYKDEPWIGGYDIINEPNWGFEDPKDVRGTAENKNEPLRKLMMDITKAIREVDKRHIIIIEGNGFGNNYRGVLPPWDDNMVLSFHKYGNFNTPDAIKGYLGLRDQYNVPLWLGESGENSNTWFTEAIGLVERHDIGWAWWQNKKMGINNPLEIVAPKDYQLLLDHWSGKAASPGAEKGWEILSGWLENLKFKNNIVHRDVIDAMFRQVSFDFVKPFRNHVVRDNSMIDAVDFDMGRQRVAYYDKDSASYQYTPGVRTTGNRGRSYRNDGVDIRRGSEGYHIYSIEDEEWLVYSVLIEKPGIYKIGFLTASDSAAGKIAVEIDQKIIVPDMPLINTGGEGKWQWTFSNPVTFSRGMKRIKVLARTGGFALQRIQFIRQ
jgi:endoglucanase